MGKGVMIDSVRLDHDQPVLGNWVQTMGFEPRWLDAVRVEIANPNKKKKWGVSEVRLSVQAPMSGN
jgi:hypothetical protein